MVVSSLIIFGNGIGALTFTAIRIGETSNANESTRTPGGFIFTHYIEMCLFMVAIGSAYLLGGVFIRKYKLWANRFVTAITVVLIIIIWTIMLMLRESFSKEPGLELLGNWPIVAAAAWTLPLLLLIRYLNRKEIVSHFT